MRTTLTLVSQIITIEEDFTEEVFEAAFIAPANELVTEVCASVLNDSTGLPYYSDVRLELIERWLSAHFYAILSPRALNERAGSVGETIESKVDLNLSVTRYGQQAMVLDTQGGLKRINSTRSFKPNIIWLGTADT